MPDNAEMLERTGIELWRVIELSHKEICYWEILTLMPDILKDLIFKADLEWWMKQQG